MSIEHLQNLFRPSSIAVVGATDEPESPGAILMRNISQSKFLGPVMPVHTELETVAGIEAYPDIDVLPLTPDLAIFCTPPDETPAYIHELGKRGTRTALILSRGEFRTDAGARKAYNQALAEAAKPHGIRILGPNCLGFINPGVGLNASLAHRDALPGKIAFVAQSDSLFTAVLDWAVSKNIGFSHLISLGDRMDIHFGTIIDYLNQDIHTRAILLYLETIVNAREFMSAARAASRNKPIVVMKTGRSMEGAMAAAAHSGAYLSPDDVYDAAFRRAGMLRVFDIDTLFDSVETIAKSKPPKGDRLAVLTNGGSPAFLATDELITGGGRMAQLSPETVQKLRDELGDCWSYENPLVIKSAAETEKYSAAVKILLQDSGVDALLVMHVPTAMLSSEAVAEAVIGACRRTKKTVLTSWLGIEDCLGARELFQKAGISTYFTPDKAVRAFLNLVQYRRNQDLLVETPTSISQRFSPDSNAARAIVQRAIRMGRQWLSEAETMDVLGAYQIPVVPTRITSDMDGVDGAALAAGELGYPVAVKVLSQDIRDRKGALGGIALDLEDENAVREAALTTVDRVRQHYPDARIQGFVVQRMQRRATAHKLFIEGVTDPVFGPILRIGMAEGEAPPGTRREAAIPPLNMALANAVLTRNNLHELLRGTHAQAPADEDAICLTLCKLSQLVIDVPEIHELEIDPMFADADGVLVLTARMFVAAADGEGADALAIRPYPRELEECAQLKSGTGVTLRPIRPEDEPAHWEFLEAMSPEDRRLRFFGNVGQLPRSEMIKLTQIDYGREMAFVAVSTREDGAALGCELSPDAPPEAVETGEVTLGVVRAMFNPDGDKAEFAVALRSDLKRQGLGRILMEKIIRYARERGAKVIHGEALSENAGMIGLARAVGFEVTKNYEDDTYLFHLSLLPKPQHDQHDAGPS